MAATLEVESTLTDRYQTTVPETVRRALQLGKRDKIHYTIRPGGEVVEERGARVAEVQGTGRTRGKARDVWSGRHIRTCYRIRPADLRPRWPRCGRAP